MSFRHSDHLVIDCDDCRLQHTASCADCIVTFVCDGDHQQRSALVLDLAEVRAVRLLTSAGLVPALRHASG
jgi:Zn-finger protein